MSAHNTAYKTQKLDRKIEIMNEGKVNLILGCSYTKTIHFAY